MRVQKYTLFFEKIILYTKKYELRRGKRTLSNNEKNIPCTCKAACTRGLKVLIGNILAKNYATSALPIKKVAAKATIA